MNDYKVLRMHGKGKQRILLTGSKHATDELNASYRLLIVASQKYMQ